MKYQLIKTKGNKGDINTLPSKTIPDQTMSIPELIRRYAQGLPLGAPKVALYDEDPETDLLGGRNWNTLDISEKATFLKSAKSELDELNKKLTRKKSNTPKTISQQTELQEQSDE